MIDWIKFSERQPEKDGDYLWKWRMMGHGDFMFTVFRDHGFFYSEPDGLLQTVFPEYWTEISRAHLMNPKDGPIFNALWESIKGWDVCTDSSGVYHGITGDQVRQILNAIAPFYKADESKGNEVLVPRHYLLQLADDYHNQGMFDTEKNLRKLTVKP
jgi:hypothetical protein